MYSRKTKKKRKKNAYIIFFLLLLLVLPPSVARTPCVLEGSISPFLLGLRAPGVSGVGRSRPSVGEENRPMCRGCACAGRGFRGERVRYMRACAFEEGVDLRLNKPFCTGWWWEGEIPTAVCAMICTLVSGCRQHLLAQTACIDRPLCVKKPPLVIVTT